MSTTHADKPAPQDWHEFCADNDLLVRVRREGPADAGYLIDLFEHMSAASRFMRFNRVLDHADPVLVAREAERLASLEPPEDNAWLAFADLPGESGAPVAGARYMRLTPTVAELAVSVRDDVQQLGIGSRLLNYVLNQAKAEGICRIMASFRGDNHAAWSLLHYSPFHTTWEIKAGQVDVVIHLQPLTTPNR